MPKRISARSDLYFRKLSNTGMYSAGEVPGLFMRVSATGAKSWILRATMPNGRRADLGLGSYGIVSLANAREQARENHLMIRKGIDPLAEREKARAALGARPRRRGQPVAGVVTVQSATESYYAIKRVEWSKTHQANWWASMENYVFPVIGTVPVADATIDDALKVLRPIWLTKTRTAVNVRARLEAVFGWAITSNHRTAPNPAIWVNQLENLLAKPGKVTKVKHHAALSYEDAPAVFQALAADPRPAAQALAFLILTVARSNEAPGASVERD